MTNYKEILRLHSLGLNNTRIAEGCGCARSTVISTLRRAGEQGIAWNDVRGLSETDVAARLFPAASPGCQYRMPDYEKVHRELQRPGVTRILTLDNLKTGVVKNSRDETVLNKSYQEMAERYGTAILPARPRKPKDKAFVEGSVGVVFTWILAALRNRQFLSLRELNEAIAEKLYEFNHKPFQKKDGSRAELFRDERLFLQPLPSVPFELAVWKVAVVQYNYHISVDKQNYSVPYEYIKRKADVRLTRFTVEIFFEGRRIASHPRLYGRPNQYSTSEDHMPPEHQEYLQWV